MAKDVVTKGETAMESPDAMAKTIVKRQRWFRVGLMVAMMSSMLLSLASPAFAADAISTGIAGGMNSFYSVLRAIAIPIAIVAAVAAAFQIFTGGEKGMADRHVRI